ncbi:MAG: alpha-amylase family glycosyl hydrolase, partial [Ferruginibacter sp.]
MNISTRNTNMYEVNIRQYTAEGTFAAFKKHLPMLKEMGVQILWLMPIHPIGILNRKGSLGSYYSIKNYQQVNPEFGDDNDFKELVDAAHALQIKVIIDWVANHTAWDNNWTISNP